MDFKRVYDTYIVLASPDSPPLWESTRWTHVSTLFGPFSTSARGTAALRSSQIDQSLRKHIPFGRLNWTPASFQKWTHGAHQPMALSQPWLFEAVEAWVPSWTASVREGIPPDFFLALHNEALGQGFQRALLFNPTIVCALGISLGTQVLSRFRASVLELASAVASPLTAYARRPWAEAFGGGFSNSIQDLHFTGLFRPGQPHSRPLTVDTFVGEWQQIPVTTAA